MENIEIKAKIRKWDLLNEKVRVLSHRHLGLDRQTDTYFYTNAGRMKLRESNLSGAYLVLYFRDDQKGPKSSTYELITVQDAAAVKSVLSKMLGVQVVVEKERDIYFFENVRIHLDRVAGLGEFLEFEAVINRKNHEKSAEIEKVKHLMRSLDIKKEDLVSESYRELKLAQK